MKSRRRVARPPRRRLVALRRDRHAGRASARRSRSTGSGEIKFADNTPAIEKDVVNTTATFSLPGEYVIRVEGNDSSGVGGGGFQCCWSTMSLKVNVKAANTGR